jgi:hypothetical protein
MMNLLNRSGFYAHLPGRWTIPTKHNARPARKLFRLQVNIIVFSKIRANFLFKGRLIFAFNCKKLKFTVVGL